MPILPHSVVQRTTDILFSKLDDEMLAIDSKAGYCYSMNESALRVWDLIAEPTPVGAVCTGLLREYAVEPDVCRREVLELLQNLLDAGLVRVED